MTAGRPEIGPALSAAWRHTRAARAELRAWQDARLRRLVIHAYESVPMYRRLFDLHRLHPRYIRGVVDLELIPFTDKAEMRRQGPGRLLAEGHDAGTLLEVATGSHSEPFIVRRTWLEDKLQYLLRLRALRSFGVGPTDRVVAVGIAARGFHRRELVDGLQEPGRLAEQLREARPDVLVGLPGVLDRLTAPELADAVRGVRPRVVIMGGEAATPAMRLRIRRTFAASIYETYASHECPLMAWECRHSGDLHTCDDGVLVEVLHEGRAADPGERGEVVVTNLHAYAMPFLRYRIGDLATRCAPCGCGAPFSTIVEIRRMSDSVPLPDGMPQARRWMLGA